MGLVSEKNVETVGGVASVRVDAGRGAKREISIVDLLIWAIGKWGVLEWIEATSDGLGGYKSNLAGVIAHLEIGGRVDGGGGVATDLPNDAIKVGFVVQSLGRDARQLIVECAKRGEEPMRLGREVKHVSSKDGGFDMPIKFDKDGTRKVSSCFGRDERGKRIRLDICWIKPVNSDASIRFYARQYEGWLASLKLCTDQLSDLEGFIIV